MITRINKNVVCIKEIPSNLLEEAIFILKTDTEKTCKKMLKTRDEIILQESNDLISDFIRCFENKRQEMEFKKENLRRKILMSIMIASIISVIIILSLSYFSL